MRISKRMIRKIWKTKKNNIGTRGLTGVIQIQHHQTLKYTLLPPSPMSLDTILVGVAGGGLGALLGLPPLLTGYSIAGLYDGMKEYAGKIADIGESLRQIYVPNIAVHSIYNGALGALAGAGIGGLAGYYAGAVAAYAAGGALLGGIAGLAVGAVTGAVYATAYAGMRYIAKGVRGLFNRS